MITRELRAAITRVDQFNGAPTDCRFAARIHDVIVAMAWLYMDQFLAKETIRASNTARVLTAAWIAAAQERPASDEMIRGRTLRLSRLYAADAKTCANVLGHRHSLPVMLGQIAATLRRVGPHRPDISLVDAFDKTMSRARGKMFEICFAELLRPCFGDACIDLNIYRGGDAGVDALGGGYWWQVRKFGTDGTKRGNGSFVVEGTDQDRHDPTWDIGASGEDDPLDLRVWRIFGIATRETYLREGQLTPWKRAKGVGFVAPSENGPIGLLTPAQFFARHDWHRPSDPTFDPHDQHPWLGWPRSRPRPWPHPNLAKRLVKNPTQLSMLIVTGSTPSLATFLSESAA